MSKILVQIKGGPGSGNWGHSGRPGLVGGSGGRPSPSFNFPRAGDMVDGRFVREDIPNTDSISASFDDWDELPGIREVKFTDFPTIKPGEKPSFYNADERDWTYDLASQIEESDEISPLIVAIDNDGPWILEGGHRFDALRILEAKSFPALVVIDRDNAPDLEIE